MAGGGVLTRREALLGGVTSGAMPSLLLPTRAVADETRTTGLTTAPMLDESPPHFRIVALAWESPFRAAGAEVGDRIVALDGAAVARPEDGRARALYVQGFVGQVSEAARWAGRPASTPVRLTLRRRALPVGWRELVMAASLRVDAPVLDGEGRRLMGAGGPARDAYDGFDGTWSSWCEERFARRIQAVLDRGWQRATFVSRDELRQLLEFQPRIDFLRQHYPGAFSTAVAADFSRAVESARGRLVTFAPDALAWREAEDAKRDAATQAAQTARDGWMAAHASETVPPFPAPHPILGNRASLVGKLVVLPPLGNADWASEADRSYFVAGSDRDNFYTVEADGPGAAAMLLALERWRRLVSPRIDESFVLAGRVLDTPRLVMVGGRSRFAFALEPVAAMVGEAMFVDLAAREGTVARFAGEAALAATPVHLPPADATPAQVLEASIAALKHGDLAVWKALFADFAYRRLESGQVVLDPWVDGRLESRWEDSRRLLLGKVFDARVAWVDDPVTVADGTLFPGAPRVREVLAELDHVGLFDGEYRTFDDTTVSRRWSLLRLDDGPWRIATVQGV